MEEFRPTVIRVENVSKDFVLPHQRANSVKSLVTGFYGRKTTEPQHALDDISLEIKQGEFFGIVGRNGSGKSTLLKILANIYQPTKGKVKVAGKLIPFIELGVGFNPELTGRENVYLNGAMLGFSVSEIDKMYDDIVSFAELERFMDQKLKNYSSGMQVRLAFSMATRADADILLIDEVLAVGDADFQRKCFDYFKTLKRDQKTVVFVSHDMGAVREFCDRAMLVENSRNMIIGDTEEVAEKYTALFMGDSHSEIGPRPSKHRRGDQSITTEAITTKLADGKLIINQSVVSSVTADNPIVGIRIRDASGKEVTGTNTKIEGFKNFGIHPDEKLDFKWELPNIFGDGTYTIDPAILYDDGVTLADWWDGAGYFVVKKKRRVPYAVDPGFKISMTKQPHD